MGKAATTEDQTMWASVLHAGILGTFLGLPYVEPEEQALRAAGAQAAIYGMPWDSTSVSRTGANYGPRGMREVSCQFLSYNATLDFDLIEALSPVDCGDCPVVLANAEKTFARAQEDISQIIAAGALPVVLGGDHSITIPAVRAVREHVERPGLVIVDTHLDTANDVGGEALNHCTEVARAVDAGFPAENIALVGHNGWANPRAEIDYCRERGITVIWLEEIWERGTARVVEEALTVAGEGTNGIYLSVDLDALDAAYAVGVSMPTPGGLTNREMLELVRGIVGHGLVGLDVVEAAPSLDPTSATAGMGGRIALDAMAFHAGARLPVAR